MPKTMKVLAFVLGLAAAGTLLTLPPVTAKEFTFDEKANAILRRVFGIPTNGADIQPPYKAHHERRSRSRGTSSPRR